MTSWSQQSLQIRTEGRETRDITPLVAESVVQSRIEVGLCHIFITHTSASLTITENADPRVHDDLEEFLTLNFDAEPGQIVLNTARDWFSPVASGSSARTIVAWRCVVARSGT